MNADDLASLAAMLDRNARFARPAGQTTGYSMQDDGAVVPAASTRQDDGGACGGGNDTRASTTTTGPAALPLPSTVVDAQLRLPLPSHSKAAKLQQQQSRGLTQHHQRHSGGGAATHERPRGDEIWSQDELRALAAGVVAAPRVLQHTRASVAPSPSQAVAANESTSASNKEADGDGAKPTPEYSVVVQQRVTAEDVYLGVDVTRDASTAASDAVVVRVALPRAQASGLQLRVTPYTLHVTASPHYAPLCVALPCRVVADDDDDEDGGRADKNRTHRGTMATAAAAGAETRSRDSHKATWDAATHTLTVTLTVDHDDGNDVKILPA